MADVAPERRALEYHGLRNCGTCDDVLPLDEFPVVSKERLGRGCVCRPCTRERNQQYDRKRARSRSRAKQRYGISTAEYDALMASPCDICGREAKHLDHCHSSGKVRAGLCELCNPMLGMARDNPALLRAAADYLEAHRG